MQTTLAAERYLRSGRFELASIEYAAWAGPIAIRVPVLDASKAPEETLRGLSLSRCAMQVRAALYECLLAGTLPVIFDPKLPQVLPFSDVVDWEALLTVLNAEDVMKKKEVPVDNLKVRLLSPAD